MDSKAAKDDDEESESALLPAPLCRPASAAEMLHLGTTLGAAVMPRVPSHPEIKAQ